MVIFLDIDGVMVIAKNWKIPDMLDDGFPVFSPAATVALNKIISEDTEVILTSARKVNYLLQEWKEIFKKRGINLRKVNRLEDNIEYLNRKDEVMRWFESNPAPKDFIIIDDDKSLNSLPSFLKEKLILTSSLIGLTEELIKHIINEAD